MTRAQKVRLGVFVATGLVLLVGGLLVLAGMKLGERRDEYVVRFTDGDVSLSGLEVGSPVKYSGIRVGRVESIRVDPDDVSVIEVTLSLEGGTPVAEDSQANLGSMGITGLKYVELTRGSAGARIREPGEEIPAGQSFLDDLTSQAGDIAVKVGTVLDRVGALTGPEMQARVARVLDRTEKLLTTLEATVAENRGSARALLERLAGTATRLEELATEYGGTAKRLNALLDRAGPPTVKILEETAGLVADLRRTRGRVDGALEGADALIADLRRLAGEEGLAATLTRVDRLLDRGQLLLVQSREDIVEAVHYLRETAENMSVLSERVREDPSLLLLGESGEDPR